MDTPTFTPSYRVQWGDIDAPKVCHFNITAGMFHFANDSTHALAGQVVPMMER